MNWTQLLRHHGECITCENHIEWDVHPACHNALPTHDRPATVILSENTAEQNRSIFKVHGTVQFPAQFSQ